MKLNFKTIKNYAILALASLALASCSNDNLLDDAPSLKAEGMATAPQGILPGVQPANGAWVTTSMTDFFQGYYKSQGNNLPGTFALNQGEKQRYAPGGRAFNGYYYTLNQTKNSSSDLGKRGIRKLRANGGSLTEVGFIQTSGGSFQGQDDEVNMTLFDATHGYYTDGQGLAEGFIGKFNPTTMQTTGNLNVKAGVEDKLGSTYTSASVRRIGTKLLIRRGNYLYADVTFGSGRNQLKQIQQSTDSVYVAVINVNTGNVEKVLVGQNARNIGLFNDHPLVNIDPITNAIYFATVADMDHTYGQTNAGKFSKIFKIADSGNSVPSSNFIPEVASYASVNGGKEGEFNTLYAYNGVVYTKLATESVRYTQFGWHGQDYRKSIWRYAMISATGNVTFIRDNSGNILMDNFYAYQQPQLINGKIYMISNSSGAKVYKITPGSTNATVVTTGIAGGIGLGLASPNKIGSIVKL